MNENKVVEIEEKTTDIVIQQSPHMKMMEICLQNGGDVSSLEKLMDLQERYEAGEAKKSFFDALSSFQSEVPTIQKQGKASFKHKTGGGNTEYTFAKLEHVVEAIKPYLSRNGLSYRHEQSQQTGVITITCIVTHKAGHMERMQLSSCIDTSGSKNGIQQIGSTVTYLRRYTLIGSLGLVVSDDDDDGVASQLIDEKNYKELLYHNELLRKHFDEIVSTKEAISNEDFILAKGSFNDIEDEGERNAVWKAPSKGGIFTTEERRFLREGKKPSDD